MKIFQKNVFLFLFEVMGTQELMERDPQNEGSALVPLKAAEFLTGTISWEKCGKCPGQGKIPAPGDNYFYI